MAKEKSECACEEPKDNLCNYCLSWTEVEDDDEDDMTFEDEIETEWEKRGSTFSEYKSFVSGY